MNNNRDGYDGKGDEKINQFITKISVTFFK